MRQTGFISIIEQLEYHAERTPDKVAFKFLDDNGNIKTSMNFFQLMLKAQAVRDRLLTEISRGERALLFYPQSLDFIVAFLGCLYAGIIPIPAYPPDLKNLNYLLKLAENSGAVAALSTTRIILGLGNLERRYLIKNYFKKSDCSKVISDLKWIETDAILPKTYNLKQTYHSKYDSIAYLQYNLESAADFKGVIVSHSNIFNNSILIQKNFEICKDTNLVSWLPFYQGSGLISSIVTPIYSGITSTLMSPVSFLKTPVRWLEAISICGNEGDITSGGPGFAYDLCTSSISESQLSTLTLNNWKLAFIGAEPVKPLTIKNFTNRFSSVGFSGKSFYNVYGLSETTLLGTKGSFYRSSIGQEVPSCERSQNFISCGEGLEGHQTLIVNPETLVECNNGELGELWISGGSVTQGYWRNAQATQQTFHGYLKNNDEGPFLRTGNIGYRIKDDIYINGKLEDLLIINGLMISCNDVEVTVSRSHPALEEMKISAMSICSEKEEALVIIIECDTNSVNDFTYEEIIACILKSILLFHKIHPLEIIFVSKPSSDYSTFDKSRREFIKEDYLNYRLKIIYDWHQINENKNILELT